MQRRRIGSLEVSVVGLGGNNFGWTMTSEQTTRVVRAALDAGITYFDTADAYGAGASERDLAAALGDRRDEAVIASKFGAPSAVPDGLRGGSAEWVRAACDASLKRLGTDRIDHYQLHYQDPSTPVEETLGALDELVLDG